MNVQYIHLWSQTFGPHSIYFPLSKVYAFLHLSFDVTVKMNILIPIIIRQFGILTR